jgi:hypothetical protein
MVPDAQVSGGVLVRTGLIEFGEWWQDWVRFRLLLLIVALTIAREGSFS